ncbi:MAG: type II toxin-antitoxin system VapC family toxin [Patescibacteria group bacterium]
MIIYFDTNIFIYLSDENSAYFLQVKDLIQYCEDNKIKIATSVETIQEIIHFSINTKDLSFGFSTANKTLDLVDELFNLDRKTIENYLTIVNKYKNRESRDFIHLATCLNQKLTIIITYDRGFKKFKEIKALTPKEFLGKRT